MEAAVGLLALDLFLEPQLAKRGLALDAPKWTMLSGGIVLYQWEAKGKLEEMGPHIVQRGTSEPDSQLHACKEAWLQDEQVPARRHHHIHMYGSVAYLGDMIIKTKTRPDVPCAWKADMLQTESPYPPAKTSCKICCELFCVGTSCWWLYLSFRHCCLLTSFSTYSSIPVETFCSFWKSEFHAQQAILPGSARDLNFG